MRARADRRARNRGADGKTLPGQRFAKHLHQRGLAAEQMGAAGDVEKQPMRRIQRHQRREAVAPVGDVDQASWRRPPRRHRTLSSAGQIARALASGRPIERPRCAAASSSAKICSALFCLATTMLGSSSLSTSAALPCTSWRLMRSMGRRGSHRLRMRRRFREKALITFPFHDPPPDRAMTIADELRVEHRRAPRTPGCGGRRMRRAHDPSRLRRRGLRLRRHPQQ